MSRVGLFFALALSLSKVVEAQVFNIERIERDGGNVILYYDLFDSVSNRSYTINIYSSLDNFINPLTEVSGDLGLEIRPGGNRKIVWNAQKELGDDFNQAVSLEVRGRIYIPFVRLDGFGDFQKFKRNKEYKITWTGGRGNQILNFNLYKGDKKVTAFPNVANVGEYDLKFENIKPGGNYYFKIEDSRNKDDVVVTETFKIKRKTPLLLKIVPIMAGAWFITTLGGDDLAEEPSIPDPIGPDN
ncbi:MAG: hypothetical protein AAGG59_00885 [Bacteroidota bacterium]